MPNYTPDNTDKYLKKYNICKINQQWYNTVNRYLDNSKLPRFNCGSTTDLNYTSVGSIDTEKGNWNLNKS